MKVAKYKKSLVVLSIFITISFIVNVIILISLSYSNKPKQFEYNKKKEVVILAAHQDDAVIQAGGLAVQNIRLGGKVEIVFLTRPKDESKAVLRRQEAEKAWALLDSKNVNLTFLDFISEHNWSEIKKQKALKSIAAKLQVLEPELIVIPLEEKGSYEHDLLNRLVRKIMRENKIEAPLLQGAEYNPYYIVSQTPGKILWFLVRLLPVIPFKEPNYGLSSQNQIELKMSPVDLDFKMQMLSLYESQADVIPEYQFKYADLFDSTLNYNPKSFFVKGKYFSPWALFTVFQALIMLMAWGALLAFSSRKIIGGVFIPIIFYSCYILFVKRWMIFDELLYIGGLSVGFYLIFICNHLYTKYGSSLFRVGK